MAQFMDAFNESNVEYRGLSIDATRLAQLNLWLAKVLPSKALRISSASEDASFRSYYRASDGAHSWIIMDAPVAHEDTEPFRRIASTLNNAGVRVPAVLASDSAAGFMLLEDLGHETLLHVRQTDPQRSKACYERAIAMLVLMQLHAPVDGLPQYDVALLRTEMELLRRWLVLRHLGLSWSTRDETHWQRTMVELIRDAQEQPRVFVHRDYHSRNLMVLDGDIPAALDFQDAVAGPVFYDLVSLLKDCYATPANEWLEHHLRLYFSAVSGTRLAVADNHDNRRLFHSMGMQRHLKAAGIFARLWHRDGKDGYLRDIPVTLNYVVNAARRDERFSWLADFIATRVLPRLDRVANSA